MLSLIPIIVNVKLCNKEIALFTGKIVYYYNYGSSLIAYI